MDIKRGKDYNLHMIGELIPGVLDSGQRESGIIERPKNKGPDVNIPPRRRLSPTNSERMNRALKELGSSAFKIHTLLWKWRGAPAKGNLPFFTIHSLSKFCSLTRPTVRSGLTELTIKGWIQKQKYNKHEKNALYRLTPIRDVPAVAPVGRPAPSAPLMAPLGPPSGTAKEYLQA